MLAVVAVWFIWAEGRECPKRLRRGGGGGTALSMLFSMERFSAFGNRSCRSPRIRKISWRETRSFSTSICSLAASRALVCFSIVAFFSSTIPISSATRPAHSETNLLSASWVACSASRSSSSFAIREASCAAIAWVACLSRFKFSSNCKLANRWFLCNKPSYAELLPSLLALTSCNSALSSDMVL